ncbi:MAG: hypothetical protein WC285_03705 [Candidatus Gracilibacteria bacterium]
MPNERNTITSTLSAVTPAEVGQFAIDIRGYFGRTIRELKKDPSALDSQVNSLVDQIFKRLDPAFKDEMGLTTDATKREVLAIIRRNFGKDSGRDEKETIELTVAETIEALMVNHTGSRINDIGEHRNNAVIADPDKQLIQSGLRGARGVRDVATAGLFLGSAITTWQGSVNAMGLFLQWLEKELLQGSLPPMVNLGLRQALGIGLGVGISAIVLNVKKAIEKVSKEQNLGFFRSTSEVVKANRRSAFMLTLACLVLTIDGATNASGIVSMAGGRKDRSGQIDDAKSQIDERLDGLRSQLNSLPDKVEADVRSKTTLVLKKEAGGTSETKKEGTGPVYHAKRYLLTEDGSSEDALNRRIAPVADGEEPVTQPPRFITKRVPIKKTVWVGKGKRRHKETRITGHKNIQVQVPRVATGSTSSKKDTLAADLMKAVESSGVIDGQEAPKEFRMLLEKYIATIEAKLAEIEKMEGTLNPGEEIEFIQQALNKIAGTKDAPESGIFAQCVKSLNIDLRRLLEERYGKYNHALENIADTAIASGRYPNAEKDALQAWEPPTISVDTSPIEVKEMEFKDPVELAKVVVKEMPASAAAIVIAFALLFGATLSHLDQLALSSVRKSHNRDKNAAEKIRREWIEKMLDSISEIVLRVLNQGPYSEYFKGKEMKIEHVRESLDSIIGELKGKQKIPLMERWMNTSIAKENNATVRAIQSFMRNPTAIAKFLETLLPGLVSMQNSDVNNPREAAVRDNDQAIEGKNTELQANQLRTMETALNETTFNLGDSIGDLNAIRNLLLGMQNELNIIIGSHGIFEANETLYAQVDRLRADKLEGVIDLIPIKLQRNDIEAIGERVAQVDAHIGMEIKTIEMVEAERAFVVSQNTAVAAIAVDLNKIIPVQANNNFHKVIAEDIRNKTTELERRNEEINTMERDIRQAERAAARSAALERRQHNLATAETWMTDRELVRGDDIAKFDLLLSFAGVYTIGIKNNSGLENFANEERKIVQRIEEFNPASSGNIALFGDNRAMLRKYQEIYLALLEDMALLKEYIARHAA